VGSSFGRVIGAGEGVVTHAAKKERIGMINSKTVILVLADLISLSLNYCFIMLEILRYSSYSGDMILNYPRFHFCFPKLDDSTTMNFSIVSPELYTVTMSRNRYGVYLNVKLLMICSSGSNPPSL
jgi:hypothetical protein